jgi:two-component sensor histidine kinase/sensor domain CHASE-containing protein
MTQPSSMQKSLSTSWLEFVATVFSKFSTSKPRSLLLLVGGSVLITTLFLWQALVTQERAYIRQEIQLAAESIENELIAGMESRIQALDRMSKRWERRGQTPQDDWEYEAGLNVRDFKGFQAIQWVDPSLRVRWVVPHKANEASLNLNLGLEPRRRTALEVAQHRRSATISHSVNLVQGGQGFLVDIPIFQDEIFRGFIVGVFRTQIVLDTILKGEKNVAPGYAIAVFDGKQEIYRRDNVSRQQEQEWDRETKIGLHGGSIWRVRVAPTPQLLAELQSPLPEVVLAGGLLMAVLLVMAVHLAQRSRLRAKQAELANQELEKEIAKRQRTESLLGVQHAIARVLAEAMALDEATPKILQTIGETLGWDLGELWLVDRQANVLHCVATWHSPSFQVPEEMLPWQTTFAPGIGLPGKVWASGRLLWISDIFEDASFAQVASAVKKGLHGAFGFPLISEGEIIGVINFFSYQNQKPEADLLQMMNDISSQSGQFVERKWAEKALRKAHDELERRVEERTVELSKSNQLLKQEVSDRKRAEEQIKASLNEKEVLLKEIHHRVKNNLQVISSLLKLQCSSIKDQHTLAIFRESQSRVESMALIHEQLYQSKNLSRIDFADYIRNLVANLFCAYEISANAVNFKIDVNQIFLDINAAIPCGLIVNELVANSLKYAFTVNKGGEISIHFSCAGDSDFTLIVSDDGIGFPKNLDFRNTETLGLQLVTALTEQLEGEIELSSDRGTEFKITFAKKDL